MGVAGSRETEQQIENTALYIKNSKYATKQEKNTLQSPPLSSKQSIYWKLESIPPKKLKIIITGCGESGKSTLFKQVRKTLVQDLDKDSKITWRFFYLCNVLNTLEALILARSQIFPNEQFLGEAQISKFVHFASELPFGLGLRNLDAGVTKEQAQLMELIWRTEPLLHKIYHFRHKFGFTSPENASDLLEQIGLYYEENKPLANELILKTYIKTTGIVEASVNYHNHQVHFVDTGGQRSERKKWIHVSDSCNAIIHVVSLSEYNHVLYEDGFTNRTLESLNLFDEIVNSRTFSDVPIYLVFTKSDVLKQKIYSYDLSAAFQDIPSDMKVDESEQVKRMEQEIHNKMLSDSWIERIKELGGNAFWENLYAEQQEKKKKNKKKEIHSATKEVQEFLEENPILPSPPTQEKTKKQKKKRKINNLFKKSPRELRTYTLFDLPDELLIYICFYLDEQSLTRVQLVNYHMYRIAGCDIVWKPLCMSKQNHPQDISFYEPVLDKAYQAYLKRCFKYSKIPIRSLDKYRVMKKEKWKFCYQTGGIIYMRAVKLMVSKFLNRVQDPKRRDQIKSNIYICSVLDENQVSQITEYICNHLILSNSSITKSSSTSSIRIPSLIKGSSSNIAMKTSKKKGKRKLELWEEDESLAVDDEVNETGDQQLNSGFGTPQQADFLTGDQLITNNEMTSIQTCYDASSVGTMSSLVGSFDNSLISSYNDIKFGHLSLKGSPFAKDATAEEEEIEEEEMEDDSVEDNNEESDEEVDEEWSGMQWNLEESNSSEASTNTTIIYSVPQRTVESVNDDINLLVEQVKDLNTDDELSTSTSIPSTPVHTSIIPEIQVDNLNEYMENAQLDFNTVVHEVVADSENMYETNEWIQISIPPQQQIEYESNKVAEIVNPIERSGSRRKKISKLLEKRKRNSLEISKTHLNLESISMPSTISEPTSPHSTTTPTKSNSDLFEKFKALWSKTCKQNTVSEPKRNLMEQVDFETVFGIPKDDFYRLPQWKQIQLKKEKGYF